MTSRLPEDLQVLQARLGHGFADPALLRQAVTHRSHGQPNNERLEFLGDSVLNCVVAMLLYERFGRVDEGDLSRLRAMLVRQQTLAEIARQLDLPRSLRLGEGEHRSGGSRRPSILGDAVEALFGAVLLDAGFEAAKRVIATLYQPILAGIDPATHGKDAKTRLQEWLQGQGLPLPVYTVVGTRGAAHDQIFDVECTVPRLDVRVQGAGSNRRTAEQEAARLALVEIETKRPQGAERRGRGTTGVA